MTHLSWMALHGMAHSFIELGKVVIHVISLISFLWLWSSFFWPYMDKDKKLIEASWWERLPEGETGSYSDGLGHAQQIFNPIFCWWVGLCSFPVAWGRPNYGGGNKDNGNLLQKIPCTTALSAPGPAGGYHWPTPLLETPGHSGASLGQSLVRTLPLSPGSWCAQGFVCVLQECVSPVLCKFWQLYYGVNGNLLQKGLYYIQVYCTQSPCSCGRPLLTCTSTGDTQI